jgi:6-phosphogluconolactonase
MPIFDLYIGTYTQNGISKGIHHSEFNSKTGELSSPKLIGTLKKPSFLALHSNRQWLYSITEGTPGIITSFNIDKNIKKLTQINHVCSGGEGPCHISLSKDEKTLFVTNYQSGSVATLQILKNGSLTEPHTIIQHKGNGPFPERQSSPHAHSAIISPNNRFLYVSDLGMDKICIYRFLPETHEIIPHETASIGKNYPVGPRHFTFHPNEKWAYGVNELENSVTTYRYNDNNGKLVIANTTSIIPEAYRFTPNNTPISEIKIKSLAAEITIHPNGRFLYCSNRGFHSIAIFKLDKERIPHLQRFQTKGINEPRHFTIAPTGNYCIVANQHSNNLTVFKINEETGILIPTNKFYAVGEPICLMFALAD